MKLASCIVLFLCISSPATALEIRGYSIAQTDWSSKILRNQSTTGASRLQNINRVNIYHQKNETYKFELGLNLNQIYERIEDPLFKLPREQKSLVYRIDDFKPVISSHESSSGANAYFVIAQLDRLQITANIGRSEIILGRQQISFGSARTMGSLDIFAPFSLTAINTEERRGVDALRWRKPFGDMGEWDLGILFGENAETKNSGAYGSFRSSWGEVEYQPMVFSYQEAFGLGFDLLTSFKGTNIWLEFLSTKPKLEKSYQRLSLGGEYQWSDKVYTVLEYHFNGAGQGEPLDYLEAKNSFANQKGGVLFLGRHYLNLMLSYQIHPLHSLGSTWYQNLRDQSSLVSLVWVWSVDEDWELNAGSFIGLGHKSTALTQPQSEFGLVGNHAFLKVKYFF